MLRAYWDVLTGVFYMQAMENDTSTLLNISEDLPGVPCPVFSTTLQEKCGQTAKSFEDNNKSH